MNEEKDAWYFRIHLFQLEWLSSNVGILFQNLEISNGSALEKWHTASYVYRTDLQLQQVFMQFLWLPDFVLHILFLKFDIL